jgi:hypothetical protein
MLLIILIISKTFKEGLKHNNYFIFPVYDSHTCSFTDTRSCIEKTVKTSNFKMQF